ncbi:hypothetical protein B0T16DRAFT_462087 [Cercophora newfieldiana]|uniref:Uncharacterized protein n=1 Tax=Cercophora newfieldiana TaxID=92897 RepID=A0AA39XXG0_9PEZI|nr:hypothetical protein B0T16DRAFT_462087 [Cercophora newfieldiana]
MAAPSPIEPSGNLNERELPDIDARIFDSALEKRANWALVGFAGLGCTPRQPRLRPRRQRNDGLHRHEVRPLRRAAE